MRTRKVFWGLLFIAAAAFIILNQMGLIADAFGFWTIVWGVFFFALMVDGVVHKSFGGFFFPLAFLFLIFGEPLGFSDIGFWPVIFAALFLTIGCNMIFPKNVRIRKDKNGESYNKGGSGWTEIVHEEAESTVSGEVVCFNRFGESTKYVNTADLKGAKLSCSFGELKVYFDSANIVNSPVTVEVHQSFGEMELYFPKEWTVNQNVKVMLGTVNERNQSASNAGPVVNLVGDVNFGEIAIIYV